MQLIFASDVRFIIWVQKLRVSITLGNSVLSHPDNQLLQKASSEVHQKVLVCYTGLNVADEQVCFKLCSNTFEMSEPRHLLWSLPKDLAQDIWEIRCLPSQSHSAVPFIYHLPTSRVGQETILSRKFILLYPLRKLLGKMPFLSKKGLPLLCSPGDIKKPQVLLHSLEISVTGNYHKPCMALYPRVAQIKETLLFCLSYSQEMKHNKRKYFPWDHKNMCSRARNWV